MFTPGRKGITVFMDGVAIEKHMKPFEARAMSSFLDSIDTEAIEKETLLKSVPIPTNSRYTQLLRL